LLHTKTNALISPNSLISILNDAQRAVETQSVLSPSTWPFSLDWLPAGTHLVGGNVRDALLGRHADYLDLDFVLPRYAVETAQAIAQHYKAGFVVLDAERQIARVVFPHATADFAQQVGDTLESDLRQRDFTVNAIAYDPVAEEIYDPLQGYLDLQQRCIRMVAAENLRNDPLRLLRAYRQAAQLQFTLDPQTRTTICQLAGHLSGIAAERVQQELNYLLSTAQGTPFLDMAYHDGLFTHWLPGTTPSHLQQIYAIDQEAIAIANVQPLFGEELQSWVRDQQRSSGAVRSWLKIAKLASLADPHLGRAEAELWRLKYSRTEVQAVLTVLRMAPLLQQMEVTPLSCADQYRFFRDAGATFPAIALLVLARGLSMEAIAPLIERFLNPTDPVAHPSPLVSGRDLMDQLNLPRGPQIGQLLEAIQVGQAEGKCSTADEAIAYARALLPEVH
jgi:tRNA nucleotidyltransferase (CCA-adding enzyme)